MKTKYRKRIKLEEKLVDKSDDNDYFLIKYLKKAAQLKTGNSFGELALLISNPRSATVKASEDTDLATLNKEQFIGIMGKVQEIQIKKVWSLSIILET